MGWRWGGSPESATRAGRLGVGMAIAILSGDPARFKPLVDLYRKVGTETGHILESLKVGITGHGYISKKQPNKPKTNFYPYYSNYWSYVNRQRGMGGTISKADFDKMTAPDTALFVGSPQQIIEKNSSPIRAIWASTFLWRRST
ncbi:hypothetical protein GCM10020331_075290 [Ectobacillus funiculus]